MRLAARTQRQNITLQRTLVLGRGCEFRQRTDSPDQPQRSRVQSDTYARIAFLQTNQSRYRASQAARPRTLGLAAPHACNGQVFAQLAQGLSRDGREGCKSRRKLWHT